MNGEDGSFAYVIKLPREDGIVEEERIAAASSLTSRLPSESSSSDISMLPSALITNSTIDLAVGHS